MAQDVATAIVEQAKMMIEQEEKQKIAKKFRDLHHNKIGIDINYTYTSDDGDIEYEDYLFLRFTKYEDELYWIVKDHETDFRVAPFSKNSNLLDLLAKSYRTLDVIEKQDYENRMTFVMNIRIPEKHVSSEGKEYTCYGGCAESITYDKNTDIIKILEDGLTILQAMQRF